MAGESSAERERRGDLAAVNHQCHDGRELPPGLDRCFLRSCVAKPAHLWLARYPNSGAVRGGTDGIQLTGSSPHRHCAIPEDQVHLRHPVSVLRGGCCLGVSEHRVALLCRSHDRRASTVRGRLCFVLLQRAQDPALLGWELRRHAWRRPVPRSSEARRLSPAECGGKGVLPTLQMEKWEPKAQGHSGSGRRAGN